MEQANSKMAEELEKVNSDLAQALKGLQEVSTFIAIQCPQSHVHFAESSLQTTDFKEQRILSGG